MSRLKAALAVALVAFLGGTVSSIVLASPASATDGVFAVDQTGITLPEGSTFQDNDHINVEVDYASSEANVANVHFEAKCIDRVDAECEGRPHELAQYIGQSFIPWSAIGVTTGCVTWVQVAGYNYHFDADQLEGDNPACLTDEEPPYVPPVVHCEPPYAPGILDDHGNPTSCVNNGPMPPIVCKDGEVKDAEGFCYTPQPPCPEGTTPVYIDDNPNGYIDHCEAVVVPPTVTPTPTPEPTPAVADDQGSPPQLAETGFSPGYFGGAAVAFIVAGLLVFFAPKRKH